MSRLNIWVRDTVHPLLPYQSTGHSYRAIIASCETPLTPLSYGAVNNGVFPLTDTGPAGGKVHGEVEVPPGTYLVRAWATCKNVFTSWAWVQVCCGETACVNLITNRFRHCVTDTQLVALLAAWCQTQNIPFSPGSNAIDIPPEVLKRAAEALGELAKHLPEPDKDYDRELDRMLQEMKKVAKSERDAAKP